MLMSLAQVLSSSYADSLQPKVYNYRQTSGPTNQPRLFHSIHPSTQLQRRKQISRTTETIASLGETGEEKGRGITACWPRHRRWWRARPPGCSAWRRCLPHLLLKLTPPSGWGAGRSIRASPAARTDGTGTGTGRWESGRGERRLNRWARARAALARSAACVRVRGVCGPAGPAGLNSSSPLLSALI